MAKIKERLAALAEKLVSNEANLRKAQRRHKKFRLKAEGISDKQSRAYKRAHAKAIYWKGRVKQQQRRINHLERSTAEVELELEKWKKDHKVTIRGSKVTGGTPRQRLKAALLRAMLNYRTGKLAGYYSQSGGARDYLHAIYHYALGRIWDCATFGDGVYLCCGLTAPSGPNTLTAGGWTGTQGEHGKRIPESQAQVGDLVLYGPFPHHHVEVVLDPVRKTTVGHGSPPIDEGVFDLFGDGDYIVRTYV